VRLIRRCGILVISASVLITIGCGGGSTSNFTSSNVSSFPPATVPLVKLSTDTFTNSTSQHATEVEPDSFAFGQTIVAAFQVGRIKNGGASDIGFATSTDGGITWQNGFLPGLTTFQGGGTNSAVSDPAVAYDALHGLWMISSLTIASNGSTQVVVSSSPDGLNWNNPVPVSHTPDPDKDWIVCDDVSSSSFYGHCYVQWDDFQQNDLIYMSTSTDGGNTWAPALNSNNAGYGIGGQPLVRTDGTVIVPFLGGLLGNGIYAFSSNNGGASWSASTQIVTVSIHQVRGGLRTDPLPSAQIDAADNIYVVWQDCSFRSNCSSNDLVMSTSSDGTTWSQKARIPIDPTTSTVDHFIPGLGIDPTTGGATAHLGLTYYYYPQANCTAATCALFVGFISSLDGGATWSAPTPVAGPMSLSWLASTSQGPMVGDYIATSFAGGKAYGMFAFAKAKSGSTFDEAIYTTQAGFDVALAGGRVTSARERSVANSGSERPPRQYYDSNRLHPILHRN
jgi:hypothetical protein